MENTPADVSAASAAAQAIRLRRAAARIRLRAGHLTYHPTTDRRPRPGPELLAALAEVEQVVNDIQQGAEERAREAFAASRAAGGAQGEALHRGHAAVDQGTQVVLAALGVLRSVLGIGGGDDSATLDAPYGSSAPSRHHPGALCTIVAERVEALARALEVVAIIQANLERTGRTPPAGTHR
jgi:hypothetical protein